MTIDVPDRHDERIPFSVAEFLDELASLSDQQRGCVVLRYVGGFTSAEIAGILDTTSATVSVQLNRAHLTLRQNIDPDRSEQCHG